MTSDLRALLAAVVADPSDDVARLVYADCLEEHGNAARAAFIRLQIEAERHHPDSNARAELERRAYALFAEHWIEWWGEVCAAVGLDAPVPDTHGRLARLATRAGFRPNPGEPYRVAGFTVGRAQPGDTSARPMVTFGRGFPDTVGLGLDVSALLPAWFEVSPLSSLTLHWGARFSRESLRTVRGLTLVGYDLPILNGILRSQALEGLESLSLESDGGPYDPDDLAVRSENDLPEVLAAPRVRQLKRLSLSIHAWDEVAAHALAGAEGLSGLESLAVSVGDYGHDRTEAGERLTTLAASPHLANLKGLRATGGFDTGGLAAVLRGRWTGLRALTLDVRPGHGTLAALAGPNELNGLEELRLLNVSLDGATVAALSRSALLKRVRHFALGGSPADRTTLPGLVAAVDRDRIETFALVLPPTEPLRDYAAELLRRWFGDRARIFSG